ncbi:ATP-binding cassette domain-containing protein [Tissierella carlieri]|uniref:ATP-binding cassette domain-containing protein n=1 Tax=Tissierella carlieri TaxID=689904 RepID=A0ABT1SHJ2_9FIRM|nr:ATP-binding cassette domain-containing protein [Tissierella carlieri]MBU5311283.1 ATP-binding cassette domain-containing protein [Tissierella carlieri]MCQ4925412.1 ATP-binding cassette domain-containing protein [Tissierella carlieri]
MLKVENLNKSFGDKKVLVNTNLEVEKGSIVMIVGESGVGKTTLIRCLCGLEVYDSGRISFSHDDEVEDKSIGLVFQNFNLFPHFSVIKNITYSLIKGRKMIKEDAIKKAKELIELLGLSGLEDSYEYQLSGGQKQRVAIARALAMEPQYLCFDEPTSALDYKLRDSVGEILKTVASKGMGVIVITHDRDFADKYGNKIYELGR